MSCQVVLADVAAHCVCWRRTTIRTLIGAKLEKRRRLSESSVVHDEATVAKERVENMRNIETIKYIDTVIRNLHLNPNKVIEISIEVNYTEAKISVLDTIVLRT